MASVISNSLITPSRSGRTTIYFEVGVLPNISLASRPTLIGRRDLRSMAT
jgi:hypothetical protein